MNSRVETGRQAPSFFRSRMVGRSWAGQAGWIAGGTALARSGAGSPGSPHHPVPEIQYDVDVFLAGVKELVATHRYCIIVVGEGIRNRKARRLARTRPKNAFGHSVLARRGPGSLKEVQRGQAEDQDPHRACLATPSAPRPPGQPDDIGTPPRVAPPLCRRPSPAKAGT